LTTIVRFWHEADIAAVGLLSVQAKLARLGDKNHENS
jgi:hypothetical protein